MTTIEGFDIVQRLLNDQPAFHLGGEAHWEALPGTLRAIRRWTKPGDTTAEVGVGASTVVFASCGAEHTAISPDPSEHERVRAYCQRAGVDDSRIRFVLGLSDEVLPSLFGRDRTLDVAFIDGAHSFPAPITDWYYMSRSVKVGGKLLLDDIPIPAVAQVFRHMRLEPSWRLEDVFDYRGAAFTLIAAPEPGDRWQQQPFNHAYPDFSFAGFPTQLRLQTAYKLGRVRYRVGQRYPALRSLYKRQLAGRWR